MAGRPRSSAARAARTRGVRAEIPITREMIVETAFRLIDERGTDAFSMRSLATELGVFPATLYWHVGDRAQLLGLVEQRWISGIELPTAPDWRDWTRQLARNYRRHAHRHPNVARLMTLERARNAENLTIPDAVLGTIAALGFGDDLVHAYNAVVGAVQGYVVVELARSGEPGPEVAAATEHDLRAVDPARFPHVTAHFDELANRALSVRWNDNEPGLPDESFEFLVELIIDGLERRAGGGRRSE